MKLFLVRYYLFVLLLLAAGAPPAMGLTPADMYCFVELDYSSYLGGGKSDYGYAMAIGSSGSVYLVGSSASSDFPTRTPYQSTRGDFDDIFISKFTSSGSTLLYSTYLGGTGSDYASAVQVDATQRAYLTGETDSRDFPTLNPYQSSFAGTLEDIDCFVTAVSSTGSELLFSTYLGGNDVEASAGLGVNSSLQAHVAGYTVSPNFPTLNPYQASRAGAYDIFVTAFSSTGSELIYSTYLGGSGNWDLSFDAVLDPASRMYVTGRSKSDNFPTVSAYQPSRNGNWDAIVSVLSSSGSSLVYSTYLGGGSWDEGRGLARNSAGQVYIAGCTGSPDFPTRNAYQVSFSGQTDAFVCCFDSAGSTLLYSTYLGGSSPDFGLDLALDDDLAAYVAGRTFSSDFPILNAYQSSKAGSVSIFVTEFSPAGSVLYYSTYFGGSGQDLLETIKVSDGMAHLSGTTLSSKFPTINPYQSSLAGEYDAFLSRLKLICFLRPRLILSGGDYDGDGSSDVAFFRPSSGLWAIQDITRVYYGSSGDIPVPADYDGDGLTDIGVFRRDTGLWAIRGLSRFYYGAASDWPVAGDYDGDRTSDAGIFRKDTGLWAAREISRAYFGSEEDRPVPGDYEGAGTQAIAVFRESVGLWAVRGLTRLYYGGERDVPVPGDYGGGGARVPALFRPSTGLWSVRDLTRQYFGSQLDQAVPSDYDGDGTDGVGVFRENTGLWAFKDITRIYYGGSGDVPVTR